MNWEDILWELVQMIETAAPKAWEIATKQVQVMYYSNLAWGIFLVMMGVGISAIFLSIHVKSSKNNSSTFYEGEALWGLLLAIIPIIIGMIFLSSLIGYSVNPEYYAIKSLVGLVGICN